MRTNGEQQKKINKYNNLTFLQAVEDIHLLLEGRINRKYHFEHIRHIAN